MTDRVDINLQALGAYAQALNNTAANIANVSTDGYESVRTVFDSGPSYVSHIQAVTEHSYTYGQNMAPIPPEIANDDKVTERAWNYQNTGGQVDIAREMVNLISYEHGYQANLQPIRTIEQNTGTLLSLIA